MASPDLDSQQARSPLFGGLFENREQHTDRIASRLSEEAFSRYQVWYGNPEREPGWATFESSEALKVAHVARCILRIVHDEDTQYQLTHWYTPHAYADNYPDRFDVSKDGFRSYHYTGDAHFQMQFRPKTYSPEVTSMAIIKLLHRLDPETFSRERPDTVEHVRSRENGNETEDDYVIPLNKSVSLEIDVYRPGGLYFGDPFRAKEKFFASVHLTDPDGKLAKRFMENESVLLTSATDAHVKQSILNSSELMPVILIGDSRHPKTIYDAQIAAPDHPGSDRNSPFDPNRVHQVVETLLPVFTAYRNYVLEDPRDFTVPVRTDDSVGNVLYTFQMTPATDAGGNPTVFFVFWLKRDMEINASATGHARLDTFEVLKQQLEPLEPPVGMQKAASRID